MPYRIAGIDVHKKMLAVVVADVEIDGDFHFERQKVGTTPLDLRGLADWLVEVGITTVAMESTSVLWKPVWNILDGRSDWELLLVNPRELKQVPLNKAGAFYMTESLLSDINR